MRLLFIVMIALVGLIQYPLWMGRGGWFSVWDMQTQVADQRKINEGLTSRNIALAAEVEDLRSGTEASEERARSELSMMRQGEVFVQVLPPGAKSPELKPGLKPVLKPGPKPAAGAKPSVAVKPLPPGVKPVAPNTTNSPAR